MLSSMQTRREVALKMMPKYRHASRKGKSQIIDQVMAVTGWCRKHTQAVLSGRESPPKAKRRQKRRNPKSLVAPARLKDGRGRKPKYGIEHRKILLTVWTVLDFCSSRRLVAGMADVLESACKHGHLMLTSTLQREMCEMSASTAERLLKGERKKMRLKGKATTKPGSLLKSQIKVRTGSQWDDAVPGFTEVDTVAHGGGSAAGEFCYTLDVTDVKTGWTALRACKNKAKTWCVQAFDYIRKHDFPYPIKGMDSDNGSEFINDYMLTYCADNKLTFTRSRPYTKNDGCFVEEKNWSVCRRFVGYGRLEGVQATKLLNALYAKLNLYINYFMPSQRLISKMRDGAHVSRKHDAGLTPYRRAMASPDIDDAVKTKMCETFEGLDVWQLSLEIQSLQDKVNKMFVAPIEFERRQAA